MKILSPKQLQQADKKTIDHEDISSWDLMERASLKATNKILNLINKNNKVSILAGSGNNGGDGLAIAYHLIQYGYEVDVHLLQYTNELSPDCSKNLKRLKQNKICEINYYDKDTQALSFKPKDVIIDAIFGIGLNRDLPEFVKVIIQNVNEYDAKKIAIDVPSGLFLSELTPQNATVFNAQITLTFQCPKHNFFLPDYGNCIGDILIIDIGLNKEFISTLECDYNFIDDKWASRLLKKRQRFTHKGNYGHLLVIGGQYGMMGSVCLTAKSALKSGVGKLSVLCPKLGVEIVQQYVPEAMVIRSECEEFVKQKNIDSGFTNICIGIGIGQSKAAVETLEFAISQANSSMLIDADALNILSKHKSLLKKIPSKSILTPHQGELKRLIGKWENEYEKISKMKQFAQKYDIVLVSKDAYTFIVYNNEFYINSTGNAGMATAGSGDTLSGIISSFLAQGYSSLDASILGVYLHGKAADLYVENHDEYSLIASDIIDYLKNAFTYLRS